VRVLLSFAGGTGHAQPMVPIARALQAAGHDVAFCGDARYLPRLETQGFAVVGVQDGKPIGSTGRGPLVAPDLEHEDRVVREHFVTELPRQRAARWLQVCEQWRPDLVVRDEMDFTAAVLTERVGLPHAVVLVLAVGSFVRPQVLGQAWDALRAQHGLPSDPELVRLHGDRVLSPFPGSLRDPQCPLPRTALAFRSETRQEAASPRPERPLVHLTLGTVFPFESGDLFERLLAGLSQLPVEVVATTGADLDPAELGAQPANVRLERWLPQQELLPAASLVVSHGGSGTVLAAAAHGLPQLVVAMGADQLHNAARVVALGIGQALDPLTATPAQARDAAAALLDHAGIHEACRRLQREIDQLPGPETTVPVLEELVRRRERQR
jgi:UDP:flavonoid glycosyltransferase YjiC (YdhE family)